MANITKLDYLRLRISPKPILLHYAGLAKLKLFPRSPRMNALGKVRVEVDGEITKVEFNNGDYGGKPLLFTGDVDYEEVFVRQAYGWLESKGKAVLDIGTGNGDTPIYFSLKGAKALHSYDPDEKRYLLARKNLSLNGITNAKLFNKAASSRTVDEFAEEFKGELKELKIDCEGCEYEIILNAKRLAEYDRIVMEYHQGYLNIERKLKNLGFAVSHTSPCASIDDRKAQTGYLYAKMKNL